MIDELIPHITSAAEEAIQKIKRQEKYNIQRAKDFQAKLVKRIEEIKANTHVGLVFPRAVHKIATMGMDVVGTWLGGDEALAQNLEDQFFVRQRMLLDALNSADRDATLERDILGIDQDAVDQDAENDVNMDMP